MSGLTENVDFNNGRKISIILNNPYESLAMESFQGVLHFCLLIKSGMISIMGFITVDFLVV